MKGDWQEIARGDMAPWTAGLHVTLNTEGLIRINRTTHNRLGAPQAALLLYDRVNHRIGLRPANPGLRNAYPFFKFGRHGGRLVRAYRLLKECGIDLPGTVQFDDARIDDDDVLVLDLRSARISKRYLSRMNVLANKVSDVRE